MSGLQAAVAAFLAERDDFLRALKYFTNANGDYWRWQGHAEARRAFGEALERAGIDLTAEPAPVVNRDRVAEVIEQAASDVDLAKYFLPGMTDRFVDALLSAGVFRAEAEVRKQVAEEIAQEQERYQNALEDAYEARMHEADALRADAVENCVTITRNIGGLS